jgi:hypothetical protein
MRAPITLIAVAVMGVASGWLANRHAMRSDRDELLAKLDSFGRPQPARCRVELSNEATARIGEQLAQIVRDRMGAIQIGSQSNPSVEKRSDPPAEVPSADAVAARDEAEQMIQRAVSLRSWTSGDAEAFRALTRQMSGVQHQEALRMLVVELNAGHLQLEEGARPF